MAEDDDFGMTTALELDGPTFKIDPGPAVHGAARSSSRTFQSNVTSTPDFGFTTVHDQQFKEAFKKHEDKVTKAVSDAMKKTADESARARMNALKEMFMPLINNLLKNPEAEWIHWPNRKERIAQFMEEVDAYIAS